MQVNCKYVPMHTEHSVCVSFAWRGNECWGGERDGGERDGGPPFANVHSVPTFHNTRNMYVNQTWKILFSKGGLISQGIKFYHCCRNQYLRNEAPDLESWRTQVYSAGGPRGVKTPSSELHTKGLQGFYIWTGMIKRVCGFAGARAIAKSRTRVGEISSSF